jgi:SAM-dependent methyltransferase
MEKRIFFSSGAGMEGLIKASDDVRALYADTLKRAEAGEAEAALEGYEGLLNRGDLDPLTRANVLNDIGVIRFRAGEHEKARSIFLRALEADPFHREAEGNLWRMDELSGLRRGEEEILEYLLSFYEGKERDNKKVYLSTHIRRLVETLTFLPEGDGKKRLLEVGSYDLSALFLDRFVDYDAVRIRYWPGDDKSREFAISRADGSGTVRFDVHNLDVQKDEFPFEEGSFDLAIACEILEHLPLDPMNMFKEMNRVLRHGGRILVTTPNVTSHRSVHAVLHQWPPYIWSMFNKNREMQHVREYTPREVKMLLEKSGFRVERLETRDVWIEGDPGYRKHYREAREMLRSLGMSVELRGEDIFALGVKVSDEVERYPSEFYN